MLSTVYICMESYDWSSLPLYEALFPAWFGFYNLEINVRCGLKLKCSGWKILIA